jgi:hypothetical protein
METIKDRIMQRLAEASKVVAKAMAKDGSNNLIIAVNDKGMITVRNTKGAVLSATNIAFNVDGGDRDKKMKIETIAKGVKSSEDLAKKLNDSKIGFTNWNPVSIV